MNDRLFDIWFSLRCGVANREFVHILEQCGTADQVFLMEDEVLDRLPCSLKLRRALANKDLTDATNIASYCQAHDIHLLFWLDDDYPNSLRALLDPPVLLYYRGRLPDFAHLLCISLVGTRNMSEYGQRMAYKIGYELAAAGAVVISGMALGVDGVSAAAAMAAGGSTVAVLGCGLGVVYPKEHETLHNAIMEQGIVLTEYPPLSPPARNHFPARNRIISGLAQATVVIEAPARSGALITAHDAVMQGKTLYAVPGNVGDNRATGTNNLIRAGAAVAFGARDILREFICYYEDTLDMQALTQAEHASEVRLEVLERFETGRCDKGSCVGAHGAAPSTHTTMPASVRAATPSPAPDTRSSQAGFVRPRTTSRSAPMQRADSERTPFGQGSAKNASWGTAQSAAQSAARSRATDTSRDDPSAGMLASLTPTQRALFALLPLDHAVTMDTLVKEGYSLPEIIPAMTVLELKGLVEILPGGLYARK